MTAIVDGIPFNLETKDETYLLKASVKIVADMIEPSSQIIIDRVTGEYVIFGRRMPASEFGICEKTASKF